MKVRKDFLLSLFILFAIPVIGYFVLNRAADDRMKISATLHPKDSISLDYKVNYLNAEGVLQTSELTEMPYILKVMTTHETILDLERLEKIMYIINDRSDLAFLLYEPELENSAKDRIMGYHEAEGFDNLSVKGDILLVDVFNRILQIYEIGEADLYGRLLEDISYALPMVDFRIAKMAENEKQE